MPKLAAGNRLAVIITSACFGLSACSECPRTTLNRADSPGSVYSAEVYSLDCGGATPYNMTVLVRKTGTAQSREVFNMTDVPFDVELRWVAATTLQVSIECHLDSATSCLPAADRRWEISREMRWQTVQITYKVGESLRDELRPPR